ncbi:MAG: Yip1 family protein [Bacteroidota bacterium]
MLKCPTCGRENDEFGLVCVGCKGFLQNRIPNLDLFETAWEILESPRSAFRRIALADRKNYVLVLFLLFGTALAVALSWYTRLGRHFDTLLDFLPVVSAGGIAIGGVLVVILPAGYHILARMMGGGGSYRASVGLLAYSAIPIILSLIFVLPIELLTFGMYLFTSNPHPYVIKPVSYIVLVSLDVLLAVWSMVLAGIGTSVVHRMGRWKSAMLVMVLLAVLGSGFAGAALVLEDVFPG